MRTSQLHQLVKNKATETPHGVYYIHFSHSPLHLFAKELMVGTIIHIRGAFSVARFDNPGNAKALTRGTSDRTGSTFFLYMIINLLCSLLVAYGIDDIIYIVLWERMVTITTALIAANKFL